MMLMYQLSQQWLTTLIWFKLVALVMKAGTGSSATVIWGEGTTWGFGFDGASDD